MTDRFLRDGYLQNYIRYTDPENDDRWELPLKNFPDRLQEILYSAIQVQIEESVGALDTTETEQPPSELGVTSD